MNFSAVYSLQNLSLLVWFVLSKIQTVSFLSLVPFRFKQAVFQQHISPICFLQGRVDWQSPRISKGRSTSLESWRVIVAWQQFLPVLHHANFEWIYMRLQVRVQKPIKHIFQWIKKIRVYKVKTIMIIKTLFSLHHAFDTFQWPVITMHCIVWLLLSFIFLYKWPSTLCEVLKFDLSPISLLYVPLY